VLNASTVLVASYLRRLKRRSRWSCGGPFRSRLFYALDATGEGTRLTNRVELELHGPGRLLGRVAVPRVREALAANLRKLKELLEE
jgi:hypothetical protein